MGKKAQVLPAKLYTEGQIFREISMLSYLMFFKKSLNFLQSVFRESVTLDHLGAC